MRVLRFRRAPVEVQNYIDDTGVQVADVIVGFRELEPRSFDEIRHIADTTRFDYYCWDLYSRVTEWYGGRPRASRDSRRRASRSRARRQRDGTAIGAFIVDRIVRAHLATMARLNISYDLLTYEGDILRLQFWARAFEILKERGAVFLQTEGRLAGCWVMPIDEGASEGAEGDEEARREKVIVRSNGVVTYVGKDIANQFWKFGLLGRDFHYRSFGVQADGRPLWSTTSLDGDPVAAAVRPGANASTTSSIRGRCICRRCLSQALGRSATRRRPRTRSTSPTRWSRCLTRRRASSATRSRRTATTPRSRSSRCPDARASASRSTICWIC